jgi:hypothetical protein
MGFIARTKDDIADAIDVQERVRKLEVMNVGRVLMPKPWKPDNPVLEIAVAHAIRACGLHNVGGTLDPRMLPEADYVYWQQYTGQSGLDTDLLWRLWMQVGTGPMYWLTDLIRAPGTSALAPAYSFTTGDVGQFSRYWMVFGPPFNKESGVADVYTGHDSSVPGGAISDTPQGKMVAYAGYPYIDGTPDAVPDGGWFIGNQRVKDARTWALGGMTEPELCDDVPPLDGPVEGIAAPMTIPVQNAGCFNNPLHPQGSSGQFEGFYYTHPITGISPHPAMMALPLDLMTGDQVSSLPGAGSHMGHRTVSITALRSRMQLAMNNPMYASIAAWYESIIPVAQSEVHDLRSGWQTLPLYPGWWGRVEVKYTNRFVTFRGRARCGTPSPVSDIFASYPNHLPIGQRSNRGTVMPAHLIDGQTLLVNLSHSFRTENLDDYLRGEGSVLQIHKPDNRVGLTPSGDPRGFEIVMDGCQFGVYDGPFDHLRLT